MYNSTKYFDGYSVAIRQHKAQHSHCKLLHGYALEFKVIFKPKDNVTLDEMNWVVDYGCFKRNGLKDWLEFMFDHTTLVEKDDPMLDYFKMMEVEGIAAVRVLDKMGCESIAKLVFDKINTILESTEGGRVEVLSVECFENKRNSALYVKQ